MRKKQKKNLIRACTIIQYAFTVLKTKRTSFAYHAMAHNSKKIINKNTIFLFKYVLN